MEGPQASVPVAVDNLHQQENKLDFPTFLQMCLPGADKIFDFLPLSTFLSLRQLSQQMKETVDSSYRFYRHLKSHVVWMRTQEELASMRDKLQELVKRNEYSLVDSIQFGLELNESTVYNYVKLTTGLLVKKISHLRISKSINEDFDVTGDEELILRENIKWLSELETFLRKSNLIYTLRSLEVDELAFNNSQKFHKFLMNISNAKKSSNQSVPEENEDPCHPLAIKIGSLKNTNEYSSYLSASGQKGTFMNAFQTQERIKSVINSNLRISLTLRQLADFANEDTNSSERLKFLSSVENIVDLQSFPSTQQMEMIPLVALENCKFDNVYGLIVVLPKPSTEPKNRPKLSPFFEHLYFAKGAWPQLGKKIKQLTIQSSESLHGDSSISRVREDDSLLPVIKLHAEGIRKSFPNLKRIQIWASLSINEWNAWWIAIKPLRNLWSLCLKPSGPVLLDEVFLPSTGYKVPPFLSIPPLDCIQIYASGGSRMDGCISLTDSVFVEVFSRMRIRSFQIKERSKTKVTHKGLQALVEGTFGKTVQLFLFDLIFDADFADTQAELGKLSLLCRKNKEAETARRTSSSDPFSLDFRPSHPLLELPTKPLDGNGDD